jgi:hypothetical protein
MSISYCFYYVKNDPNKEKLGKVLTNSRLAAAKEFAEQKRLPLKTFLSIWTVEKKKVI